MAIYLTRKLFATSVDPKTVEILKEFSKLQKEPIGRIVDALVQQEARHQWLHQQFGIWRQTTLSSTEKKDYVKSPARRREIMRKARERPV